MRCKPIAINALAAASLLLSVTWASGFTLTSPEIEDGDTMPQEHVYDDFGCTGDNVSPALSWDDPPEGTESLALTMFDPDAPTGSGWWHWVVFNIPADTRQLPQGAGDPEAGLMPDNAVQSRTDFGTFGYGGPCPPGGAGPHRYEFTLWALSVEHLPLDAEASGAMVGFFLRANEIDRAELTVTYGR